MYMSIHWRLVYFKSIGSKLHVLSICVLGNRILLCRCKDIPKSHTKIAFNNKQQICIFWRWWSWIPWNLSLRYIHCTGQFTPKMKANAEPRLLSSLVWIDSGVVVSQHRLESFFHDFKCNGMMNFMEFMNSVSVLTFTSISGRFAGPDHSFISSLSFEVWRCFICYSSSLAQLSYKISLLHLIVCVGYGSQLIEKLHNMPSFKNVMWKQDDATDVVTLTNNPPLAGIGSFF